MYKLIIIMLLCIHCLYCTAQTSVHKHWLKQLPNCPCIAPDQHGVILQDGWAKDKGDLSKYHKGAVSSYRSYPPVKTSYGKSGQQCCYDATGNLITSGPGAGTPDKKSTCRGEHKNGMMKLRLLGVIGHIRKDVQPWNKLMKQNNNGWMKYNREWIPNKGENCDTHISKPLQ